MAERADSRLSLPACCITRPTLPDVLRGLFRDAKVAAQRVSARGDRYSMIDGVLQEYLNWESMLWE